MIFNQLVGPQLAFSLGADIPHAPKGFCSKRIMYILMAIPLVSRDQIKPSGCNIRLRRL